MMFNPQFTLTNTYRQNKIDKWLCGDIPSYRLILIIQNDTGAIVK